jgi:hypothetical protein
MAMADELAISYGNPERDRKRKYGHAEFDDQQVESLAKYFKIDSYPNLCHFLQRMQRNKNF